MEEALDSGFSEVMVEEEDFVFVEIAGDKVEEFAGALGVRAEGFFDD